jgi:hypothetical protein
MQIAVRTAPGRLRPDVVAQLLKPIATLLRTGNPAATMDRLFTSQHVTDLRLIIAFALSGVVLAFLIGLPVSIESQVLSQWGLIEKRHTDWIFLRLLLATVSNFLTFFAPVFAVFGAVLAWAYQVGSARLGVVDLFACEISTLCRVAVVVDMVRHYVDRFDQASAAMPSVTGSGHVLTHRFTSEENYFPVFENNTRDLEALEARVVINITAFYTYMKAVRDSRRALAETSPQPGELESPSHATAASWQDAARNVVYMLFLGLESARHAILDLVEFEPEKAERTIVILISELQAYGFLCEQFTDEQDIRHQRLMLRVPDYLDAVPKLWRSVEANRDAEKIIEGGVTSHEAGQVSQWEPALRLVPELKRLYEAAMPSIAPKSHVAGA